MKARIIVRPRREILDPQGKAVRAALERLGFPAVRDLRVGKSFDIDLDAENTESAQVALREMCERLLVNPVVEDFEILVLDQGGAAS